MNNTILKLLFAVFFSLFIASCGGSGSSSDTSSDSSSTSSGNPLARSAETFGVDGNLYKPVSDLHGSGGGNLVVLLSSKFTTQFDSCEIKLNTGETAQLICINTEPWTQIPFSCFSNGNRQTWRANFRCSSVAEVKVTCRSATQEIDFTVPEAVRNQVCSRFG